MKIEKAVLPADVLFDPKLSASGKIILGILHELRGKEDELVISLDELAENCGMPRKVVTRSICELLTQHKIAFHHSLRDESIRKTFKPWSENSPEPPGKKKRKSKISEVENGTR